jgi:hypothetical protein
MALGNDGDALAVSKALVLVRVAVTAANWLPVRCASSSRTVWNSQRNLHEESCSP